VANDLFRAEALEHQATSSTQRGRPTGVLPPSWSWLSLLLVMFMVSVVTFLFTADMARKETVRGTLRADGPEAKVYPIEAGIISAVFVENGDTVEAGTPIFEISSERYLEDGTELSASALDQLSHERKSLLERQRSLRQAATLAMESAKLEFETAVRKEAEAQDQKAILEYRLETARKRKEDLSELKKKGLIAEPVYNERVEAVSVLRQNLLQAQAQLADAQSEQLRIETERKQIQVNLTRDLSDLDQRLSQIDGQSTRTKAQKGHTIVAPSSGRIAALSARVGEFASPNTPLAIILPSRSQLIAEIYVPTRAIGFVTTGQTVKLQYDAFPYQKFGLGRGKVILISNTSQQPQELGVPSQTGEPLYEVRVALDKQTIRAFKKEMPLQSGMELSADIVLEDRKIIEWFMEPFLSAR
jgi:membrane fusion protein